MCQRGRDQQLGYREVMVSAVPRRDLQISLADDLRQIMRDLDTVAVDLDRDAKLGWLELNFNRISEKLAAAKAKAAPLINP